MAVALARFPEGVSVTDQRAISDLVAGARAKILPAIERGEKRVGVGCVEMSDVARPMGEQQWLHCKAGWLRGQARLMWDMAKSVCDDMEQFLKLRAARIGGGVFTRVGRGAFRSVDLTGLVLCPALEPVIPSGSKETWSLEFRPDGYRIVIKIGY